MSRVLEFEITNARCFEVSSVALRYLEVECFNAIEWYSVTL